MLSAGKPRIAVSTVALIGPDGAGKTTVASRLLQVPGLPLTYLYMGVNIESSNVALPTSRLVHWLKVRRHKQTLRKSGRPVPKQVTLHGLQHRSDRRGKLGAFARLIKRISEESYRQIVSWIYQWRGHIVLYDRHFLFDACPPPSDTQKRRLTERIHHYFLRQWYPRPGLVIFLDASPEVLYERKQEVPIEYLRRYREKLLERQVYAKKFVAVDAEQPFDEVIANVIQVIVDNCFEGGSTPVVAEEAGSPAK